MKKRRKRSKIHPRDVIVLLIRLAFFVFYPALFSSAFTGVKELITKISGLESLGWTAFSITLVVLLGITICFGRIFCGYMCAFGTYGDFLYFVSSWVQKKAGKKPFHVFKRWQRRMKYLKYLVLLVILLLCASELQNVVSQNSPWTAFSLLHAGKIPDIGWGIISLGVISFGMLLEPRFFCRFLCPMGAVFAMMPVMPWAVVKRSREKCAKGCSLCQRICPAAINIPDGELCDSTGTGECFACRKCMDRCPKKNIYTIKKNSGF